MHIDVKVSEGDREEQFFKQRGYDIQYICKPMIINHLTYLVYTFYYLFDNVITLKSFTRCKTKAYAILSSILQYILGSPLSLFSKFSCLFVFPPKSSE